MKHFLLASLLSLTDAASWDYQKNGDDWPDSFPNCGATNQSPIDLRSPDNSKFNYDILKDVEDIKMQNYSNQIDEKVNWNGHTSQVDLDKVNDVPNQFTSLLAEELFGADTEFEAQQFHFHAGSEHTIDGERIDFEMHTVHFPKETKKGIIAGALGIFFSVENFNIDLTLEQEMIVDTFFESLRWDKSANDSVEVDLIAYGNLMNMVNYNRRWIYKGSVTTPPCATFVYWNVLSTIYPMKKKHLDLFVNEQLNKGEGGTLDEIGNYRNVQDIDDHQIVYLDNGPGREDWKDRALSRENRKVIIFIVLFVLAGAIADVFLFMYCQASRQLQLQEAKMEAVEAADQEAAQ